jgi:hypothetical protein
MGRSVPLRDHAAVRDEPGEHEGDVDGERRRIAERFRAFAADPAHDTLYAPLAARLADEPAALDLLAGAPDGQRRPVLLFAAVHELVLAGAAPELAACYPSAGGSPRGRDVASAFLHVLREHRAALARRLTTATTQTNEVGRCAALLVAHAAVADATGCPLGLVELGASAGLGLWFDDYGYEYADASGDVARLGAGPPVLRAERRAGAPPAPRAIPAVARRLGVDLAPIDVHDPAGVRWLEACLWPDELDRLATFRAAVARARQRPSLVRRGDAIDDVGALVAAVPAGAAVVVAHSWMLTYVASARRPALGAALLTAAATRGEPLWWVTLEAAGMVPGLGERRRDGPPGGSVLGLTRLDPDGTTEVVLAVPCHHHGRWLGGA